MSRDRELIESALPGYEIGTELGRGAWGVVYGGRHRDLGREVAVKQLPRAFAADPAVRERFVHEARMAASLDHPHIVQVYDFVNRDDGVCLIVMERCFGSVADRFRTTGIATDEACAAALATCAALEYAHGRSVLHRDIKPENLLYDAAGTVVLGDFGIARALDQSTRLTATGTVVGTPAYMSPEQASGEPVSPASDVYSTGVMLYELLSGALPFDEAHSIGALIRAHLTAIPKPLAQVAPDVPSSIVAVVDRSLRKDPADRYESAEAFGVALAEGASRAFGPGWLRRRRFELSSATAIVAATERDVGGSGRAGTVVVQGRPEPDPSPVSNGGAGVTAPPPPASGPDRATVAPVGGAPAEPPAPPFGPPPGQPAGGYPSQPPASPPVLEPPPPVPPVAPAAARAAAPSDDSKRPPWALIGGVAAIVAAVAAVLFLLIGGGGDEGDDQATTTVTTAAEVGEPDSDRDADVGDDGGDAGAAGDADADADGDGDGGAAGDTAGSSDASDASDATVGGDDSAVGSSGGLRLGAIVDPDNADELATIRLAIDDLNAAGGVLGAPVELLEPANDAAAAGELVLSGASVIVGPGDLLQSQDVVANVSGRVPIISYADWFRRPFDAELGYYRTASMLHVPVVLVPEELAGAGRVTIVFRDSPDTTGGLGVELLQELLEAEGMAVTVLETDFDADEEALAAAVAATDPDGLVTFGLIGPSDFYAALGEAGITPASTRFVAVGDDGGAGGLPDGAITGIVGFDVDIFTGDGLELRLPMDVGQGAAQAYDAVVIAGLAAEAAGTADPVALQAALIGVTRDGESCSEVAACLDLLRAGSDIDYQGGSGPIDLLENGHPGAVVVRKTVVGENGFASITDAERVVATFGVAIVPTEAL